MFVPRSHLQPIVPVGQGLWDEALATPREIKRRPDPGFATRPPSRLTLRDRHSLRARRSAGPGPAERCSRAAQNSLIDLRNCSRNALASARSDSHSRESRANRQRPQRPDGGSCRLEHRCGQVGSPSPRAANDGDQRIQSIHPSSAPRHRSDQHMPSDPSKAPLAADRQQAPRRACGWHLHYLRFPRRGCLGARRDHRRAAHRRAATTLHRLQRTRMSSWGVSQRRRGACPIAVARNAGQRLGRTSAPPSQRPEPSTSAPMGIGVLTSIWCVSRSCEPRPKDCKRRKHGSCQRHGQRVRRSADWPVQVLDNDKQVAQTQSR